MEISKSISYVTEDPRWQQKLLVATGVIIASSVLMVVIIGVLGYVIFAGYCIRLLQNVRDGQTYPLPEWDQWGEDLARGFKLFVATFVWALPLIIFSIPTVIGGSLMDTNNEAQQFFGFMFLFCGGCLNVLFGLLLLCVAPGISIAIAKDEQISSGLKFREIISWTQTNIGQVLVVTLVYLAASIALSLIAGIVGTLLCLVGLVVTIPLATVLTGLFQYHLYGQLAYNYPYPLGSSSGIDGGIDPMLTSYTPSSEMAPGVTPSDVPPVIVPPVDVPPIDIPPVDVPPSTTPLGSDAPVGDSTDYPDSGVDNPAPPPPTA